MLSRRFIEWSYKYADDCHMKIWVQYTGNEEALTQLSTFMRDEIKENTKEIRIDLSNILSEKDVDVRCNTLPYVSKQVGKVEMPLTIYRSRTSIKYTSRRECCWKVWLDEHDLWFADSIYEFFVPDVVSPDDFVLPVTDPCINVKPQTSSETIATQGSDLLTLCDRGRAFVSSN